jgi:hypothetical protein
MWLFWRQDPKQKQKQIQQLQQLQAVELSALTRDKNYREAVYLINVSTQYDVRTSQLRSNGSIQGKL